MGYLGSSLMTFCFTGASKLISLASFQAVNPLLVGDLAGEFLDFNQLYANHSSTPRTAFSLIKA